MKKDKFVTYRIILLPNKSVSELAKQLANEVSTKGDIYFKIDNKINFAHITIYKVEFPTKNKRKFFSLLRSIVKNTTPFELQFNKLYSERGWVGLDFKKGSQLYSIHKKVLKIINPLREGHISEKHRIELKDSNRFPGRQREYIKAFGYPQVMTEYHPHLTFLRFKDEKTAEKIQKEYNQKGISIAKGIISGIAVVTGDEHGTVNKFVKKFMFKV